MAGQQTIEQPVSSASAHPNGKASTPEQEALILRDPDILEGKPFMRGTRMGVHSLIGYLQMHGGNYGPILTDFPHLTKQLIDAAVAFYNRGAVEKAEIDGILEANARHYQQALLAQRGLVSQFPDRDAPRPPRAPRIKFEGPPVSQTIIEERR